MLCRTLCRRESSSVNTYSASGFSLGRREGGGREGKHYTIPLSSCPMSVLTMQVVTTSNVFNFQLANFFTKAELGACIYVATLNCIHHKVSLVTFV